MGLPDPPLPSEPPERLSALDVLLLQSPFGFSLSPCFFGPRDIRILLPFALLPCPRSPLTPADTSFPSTFLYFPPSLQTLPQFPSTPWRGTLRREKHRMSAQPVSAISRHF
ncbi:hypothetical protein H1C71_039333 [Ictidomys tridecemlineatus]|nr:hypothetical protein H1C71_039333 [Ictidomys tridecemlineatus]